MCSFFNYRMEMFSNSARERRSHFGHWIAFAHSPVLLCVRLQEVNATPVRFISDLLVEDTWSHVFMDTLAPRGFVKVQLYKWTRCVPKHE